MNETTGSINYMQVIDPWDARRKSVDELDTLVGILCRITSQNKYVQGDTVLLEPEEDIAFRIRGAIHTSLDGLFPDQVDKESLVYQIEHGLIKSEELNIIHKKEPLSDKEADEVITKPNYHHWTQASYYLNHIPGCKIARAKWDNSINEEYVCHSGIQMDGKPSIIKYYKSADVDYYKKVEHTYKPSEEDKEATDWYIL